MHGWLVGGKKEEDSRIVGRTGDTYHFEEPLDALLDRFKGLVQPEFLGGRVSHFRLYEAVRASFCMLALLKIFPPLQMGTRTRTKDKKETRFPFLPRMNGKRDDLGILHVDLLCDQIERRLAGAVHGVRDGRELGAADRAGHGPHGDEHWRRRLLAVFLLGSSGKKERPHRSEQVHRADDVDGVVLEHVGGERLVHGRVQLRDARVGDDHVERRDAVLGLQGRDGLGRVGRRGAVDLDHDQLAAGILGEVGEGFAAGARRVADGGDDHAARARQVYRRQGLTDACGP